MMEVASVLFGRQDIRRRVEELAAAITGDYRGREPVLISVLKGGTMFLADLFRRIDLPVRVDFMAISRYGEAPESLGRVRILMDIEADLSGRDVVLVEDIVDTGLTLSYLLGSLRARQPASIAVCTLLDRSVRRIAPVDVRYVGFDCPDRFVVGYGLDHLERYRNLRDIYAIDDMAALREDVGTVSLPGGTVTVRTGAGLEALVPIFSVGKVTRTIAVAAGVAFPPAPGEQVATLEVAIPGLHLGSVPLVAADIPPPPPVSHDGPWWERATGSVLRAVSGTIRAAIE